MRYIIGILFSVHTTCALNDALDVVIPCHDKDLKTLELCIKGANENIRGLRKIFVISRQQLTPNAQWIDESIFPFTKNDVASALFRDDPQRALMYQVEPENRINWIYQQLLKLYAPITIPEILPNVLILDADTIFLRPVRFIDDDGYALFNVSNEAQVNGYFEHIQRVLPGLSKVFTEYSGITHHMLFQRNIIIDLFGVIETGHGHEPWRSLCFCIDNTHLPTLLIAEYELYFNFVFARNYRAKIRTLRYRDMPFKSANVAKIKHRKYFDYVACHSYLH